MCQRAGKNGIVEKGSEEGRILTYGTKDITGIGNYQLFLNRRVRGLSSVQGDNYYSNKSV